MCGQKLVPLTIRETVQFEDHALAAWRELEVTRRVSDFVLNYIAPSFALYGQWSYIDGVSRATFENPGMKARFRRSAAANQASNSMREARGILADLGPDADYHTEDVRARLYDAVFYAQSFVTMSSTAILHLLEDVGRPLHSLDTYNRRQECPWPAHREIYDDVDQFAHMVFDFAYGAHCLHSRLGVAHTDLHGGNLTFYMWGLADLARPAKPAAPPPTRAASSSMAGSAVSLDEDHDFDADEDDSESSSDQAQEDDDPPYPCHLEFTAFYEDPVAVYVAGPRGEADAYVFPSTGTSGCIIDFSRCVLGPAYREHLAPEKADLVYRDQAERVVRALKQQQPELMAGHEAAVRALTLAHLDVVFPVVCAADFATIGSSLMTALHEAQAKKGPTDKRLGRVSKQVIAFATMFSSMANEMFVARLQDLIEIAEDHYTPNASGFEFDLDDVYAIPNDSPLKHGSPGEKILQAAFDQWRFPRWARENPARVRTAQVVDAYNYGNPLRYSGADYAKWPAWARLDEIEKHLGSYKLSDLFDRGVDLFLSALGPNAGMEEIAAALAEKEKI